MIVKTDCENRWIVCCTNRDTGPALDDATLFTMRKYATTSNKVVTSQSGFDDGPENPFKMY